jgi:soluble lytic murein transglycosylase-like protein
MMLVLSRGMGAIPAPPANIQTALQNASSQYGVPYSLLQAVAFQESSYNPTAVSSANAQGLMQIMPANFASFGITNPNDPQQSANAGAQYLAQLYQQYGDWNTALIAYNQGPGALAANGPYSSSQQYAQSILNNAGLADSASAGDSSGTLSLSPDTLSLSPDSTDASTPAPSYTTPLLIGAAAVAAYALFG